MLNVLLIFLSVSRNLNFKKKTQMPIFIKYILNITIVSCLSFCTWAWAVSMTWACRGFPACRNGRLLGLVHLGLGSVDDVGLKRVSSRNGRLLGLGYWRLNLSLLNAPCNNFFRVMTAPADFFESPLMMDRVASGDLILNDIDVSERTRDVCHACIPHKG